MEGAANSQPSNGAMDPGMLSRIHAILDKGNTEPEIPEETPAVDTAEAAPADGAAAEAAPETPAEEPAPEPAAAPVVTASEKAKLARALADNERLQADMLRFKKDLDSAKELTALVAKVKAGDKAAAFELLKHSGAEFDELAQGLIDKKIVRPETETPEARKQRELDERLAKIEEREKAIESKAIFDQEIAVINDTLDDDSPLKALSWAPAEIHRRFYEKYQKDGKQPRLDEVIAEFEEMFVNDHKVAANKRMFKAVFSDPTKLDALLADEDIKKLIVERLGVSTEKPGLAQQGKTGIVAKGGPSSLTRKAASEVPVRKPNAPPTDAELRANAIRAFSSGGTK